MVLFRSLMFVPGNQERKLAKVQDLSADVIIYDLEDSVPPGEKSVARKLVARALTKNKHKVNYVRVNDLSTDHFSADLTELVSPYLHGIMLPKANRKEDIQQVDQLLTSLEEEKALPQGSIAIMPLIESAAGVYHAYEIARSSPRVKHLAFGAVDYSLDVNAKLTKEGLEMLYARSQLVIASRAAGIESPIDTVHIDIRDEAGLYQEARLARQLGFQGKLVIHPAQIDIVHEVFSPTAEEIEEAKEMVNAYEQALREGLAAIQFRGQMVDLPVVERAKRIIEQARELGLFP